MYRCSANTLKNKFTNGEQADAAPGLGLDTNYTNFKGKGKLRERLSLTTTQRQVLTHKR